MIRFGIIGTARIARLLFARPLVNAEITGIASRLDSRAEEFARQYGIPRRYGSYDALLQDPDIEAVYIPLPQHLHCEYTVKAAKAGKHVLVEKPAALNQSELNEMIAACDANRVLFMEGLMYRFKNIHNRAKEMVGSGLIGNVRYIDFNWCIHAETIGRGGFRMEKNLGGGALYDLGIYGFDFIRFVTGENTAELLRAFTLRRDSESIDDFTHAVFRLGDIVAAVTCAYNTDANYYTVSGEKGAIHAPFGVAGRPVPNVLQVHLLGEDRRFEEQFVAENPYILEMEYFARCIEQHEQPVVGGENSLQNMRLLEEILRQGVQLRWGHP